MEYNQNNAPQEDTIDLRTIAYYLKKIMNKWWAVLLSAVICASAGFVIAKVSYTPMYSCNMQFNVDNKREDTVTGGQSSADINAGISLALNYKKVMTDTKALFEDVAKNSGYNLTAEEVRRMITCSVTEETSIISINVISSDPEVSYAVAVSYLNNYSKVTEKAFSNTRAIVFDPPVKPTAPNPDNRMLTFPLIGFILGALAVAGAICISVMSKGAVKSADDITNKLQTRIMGTVVHMNDKDKKNPRKNLLVTDKRVDFMFAEAFKLLRIKLESYAKRHEYKTFVFTSGSENEGKTTVSVNTALSLAKNGKSVLLIDGDLRKPAVNKVLGITATNETGIAGIINGEKTLNDSIKYFEKYNIFLLISGRAYPDSAEILSTEEMSEIIEQVREEFDYIIIDTPPAGLMADASILSQYADACIMVVRNDFSSMRRVKKAMENITSVGTEVLGCVYNDADSTVTARFLRKNKKGGYKNEYSSDYGYGYGYGNEGKR